MVAEALILGDGRNAGLVRELDWAATSLGPMESWSSILLASVNTILAAPIPMQLFWGPDLVCIYNDAMTPALSDKHPGSLGQPARIVWREAWEMIGPQMERVLSTGKAVSFGNALVPLLIQGVLQDRYWTYSYSPVYDEHGRVAGVLDVAQDTTDHVQAARSEQARKAADQRLASFTVATNDVLYEMSADWSVVSQLDERSFASAAQWALADWLQAYIAPEDRGHMMAAIRDAIDNRTNFELEHRVRLPDGGTGWSLFRAIPILDGDGGVQHWFGAARDITDRKRNEEEIARGRTQLRLALNAASLASWYYDPDRNVVGGDPLMARLFGLTVPEGPAEIWLGSIVEEDRARVGQEFAAAIAGAPYDTEYRVRDGEKVRWIRAKARVVHGPEGRQQMVGICEDVTERKQTEATLRETVERLALAQQVGNIAAWEWNLETGLFTWDAAAANVYGRPPEQLGSLDEIQSHIHKDDLPHVTENIGPTVAGKAEFNAEFRVCWPDGGYHWLIGKGRPVLDDNGRPVRIIGVNIDITGRRTAELALRQSEKLAAVGQLASTISHEINNPLEAVTNLLFLAQNAVQEPLAQEYLQAAEVELRRVSAITNQTLRFHRQQSAPTELSCLDIFTNALMIFQGRINNAGITVEKRKRAERPVSCYEGEIRQVMNNLIGNAIDAMKQGGRLLVRSAEGTDWKTGRRGLKMTVADTGVGMSKATLGHLFQPFFTTKGINGTGLGLWVSSEIVQRHSGRLMVRSSNRPGRSGTVFTLFLPFDALS